MQYNIFMMMKLIELLQYKHFFFIRIYLYIMWCVWKILKTKYCVGLQHGHTITFMFSIGTVELIDYILLGQISV